MEFKNFYEEGQSSLLWYTDKGTNHSYIEHYYSPEFTSRRAEKLNILEIGIWDGGSIKLWKSWFINSNIIGIDDDSGIFGNKKNTNENSIPGATLIWDDAYSNKVANQFEDNYFDYIIDDGPHTFDSHKLCIEKWLPKLKQGGKCIIEDVYYLSEESAPLTGLQLISLLDNELYSSRFFDFRTLKGRGDDIIFEITKK
jgi:hypothetical protein